MSVVHKPVIYIIFPVPGPKNYTNNQSGGTVRFIESIKNINHEIDLHIVSPKYNLDFFKKQKLNFTGHEISNNLKYHNFFDLCLYSTILTIKFILSHRQYIADQKIILYSTSDLYWETIPNYILKKKYPDKIKWVQPIFHLYPNWKTRPGAIINSFFGYYFQKVSHLLVKQQADIIFTINQLTTHELISQGFNSQKIYQTGIGIYLPKYQKSPKIYDGIFVGRLDPSKGIYDLIKITKNITNTKPNFKIVLVGNFNQNILNQFVNEIKLNHLERNIIIRGPVSDITKNKLYSQSRLFIFPSHEEGWGMSIAEAMSYKLPVFTWNLPVYSYVYPNQLITSVENNIEDFSTNVIHYLVDTKLARAKGISNYDFIKSNYSWKKIANSEYDIITTTKI